MLLKKQNKKPCKLKAVLKELHISKPASKVCCLSEGIQSLFAQIPTTHTHVSAILKSSNKKRKITASLKLKGREWKLHSAVDKNSSSRAQLSTQNSRKCYFWPQTGHSISLPVAHVLWFTWHTANNQSKSLTPKANITLWLCLGFLILLSACSLQNCSINSMACTWALCSLGTCPFVFSLCAVLVLFKIKSELCLAFKFGNRAF